MTNKSKITTITIVKKKHTISTIYQKKERNVKCTIAAATLIKKHTIVIIIIIIK